MDEVERHFVLVHGAGHGAWCWYKLATLLRSAGHRVTALDMAASGVHPKRLDEVCSLLDYCEPLMEFMEHLPVDDRVVLVGHSRGGIFISMAMERYPEKISIGVFITAFMPGPNLDFPTINQEGETVNL
ncbi:methyl jasmonate esterase 1-like [Cornus florida]|uniref:methyl jasmonate esterase 1-like n=1 Tax=Cornus florida TaxID=4283 RepID=UPI00289EECE9|nr:methyl jasmonate esterase 1-like [Cornus florida]